MKNIRFDDVKPVKGDCKRTCAEGSDTEIRNVINANLERMIAYHCGPALAGIKASNMISCFKKNMPDIHDQIHRLNSQLNSKNIYLEIMCECDRRVYLMVYRRDILEKQLSDKETRDFLAHYGYCKESSIEGDIEMLKTRLKGDLFPHEIGVFLGYPLHDIRGFLSNEEKCLLVGDWKVYKNAEEAEELFARFKACRKGIIRRLSCGYSLAQVFCAV